MSELRSRFGLIVLGPPALYVMAVFYAGTARSGPDLGGARHGDKVMHALAFAGMAVVAFRALTHALPDTAVRPRALSAAAFSVAVGGLLELVQSLLPYRSAEWLDLVADAAGAALAAGVCSLLYAGPSDDVRDAH